MLVVRNQKGMALFQSNTPQFLVSAGVIKSRKATCWPGIRNDIIAAGALYKDCEVVIDGNFVSSRSPADFHAFGREMISITKHL